MGIFIIGFSILLAALVDYYIYKRVIARLTESKLWRRSYILYAAIVNSMVIGIMLTYSFLSDPVNTTGAKVIMWVIYVFFLNAIPKFIYVFFSVLDDVVKKIIRSPFRVFSYIGIVGAVFSVGAMLFGATRGRTHIEVREVELFSEKLPESFDGLRIVMFSDVHIGNLMNGEKELNAVVECINSLDADIVVNGGDLVNIKSSELKPKYMDILSGIKSKYGVYSVLGNHDLGFYVRDSVTVNPKTSVEDLIAKQQSMGWNVLVNQSALVANEGSAIVVSGVSFPSGYKHNGHNSKMSGVDLDATYKDVADTTYNILISHAPQLWDEILAIGKSDLTLSGHVHAMQMKMKIGKWAFSPSQIMYKRWSGLYQENGRDLYINDGIGYVMYPMRIGTYPEVTLITVKRKR